MHQLQSSNHAIVINPDKHIRRFNLPVLLDVTGIVREIVIRSKNNNL